MFGNASLRAMHRAAGSDSVSVSMRQCTDHHFNYISRFRALFELALQRYEKQTEISLAKHALAEQLQNCDSVDSVIAVLQEQYGPLANSEEAI
jgi:hypothetical protein